MADGKPAGLFERARQAEQRGNRDVRDLWERYGDHRRRVTSALLALAPAGSRLGLLGAGNGNDLDLEALAAHYGELHLVDLDPTALSRAIGRQSPAARTKLRCHAPVDLSGLYHQLGRKLPAPDDLVAAGTAEVGRQLPADLDVVASCCVLSQMSWALEHLLDQRDTPLPALQQALLRIHLRSMLGALRPGGRALLLADLVSSNSHPLDELPEGTDLRALATRLARERLGVAVCNPELVKLVVRRDPGLEAATEPPRLDEPWLWTGPKELTYLVCPLLLQRRS
jgi:hypothetical protein